MVQSVNPGSVLYPQGFRILRNFQEFCGRISRIETGSVTFALTDNTRFQCCNSCDVYVGNQLLLVYIYPQYCIYLLNEISEFYLPNCVFGCSQYVHYGNSFIQFISKFYFDVAETVLTFI